LSGDRQPPRQCAPSQRQVTRKRRRCGIVSARLTIEELGVEVGDERGLIDRKGGDTRRGKYLQLALKLHVLLELITDDYPTVCGRICRGHSEREPNRIYIEGFGVYEYLVVV